MALILEVVLIVCMLLWLFTALPFPAAAPYSWGHPLLAWICMAIIIWFVFAEGHAGRLGSLHVPSLIG